MASPASVESGPVQYLLRRVTVFIAFVLATLQPSVLAAQSGAVSDPYSEAVRIGVQEFSHGNYAESLAAMRRAHSIKPSARTLRGIGMAAFELGDYVHALEYLKQSLSDSRKPLPEKNRTEVKALIRRASLNVASVTLRVTPEDAQVRVDGGPATPLDPSGILRLNLGAHSLEVLAKGHESQQVRIVLQGGDESELKIDLPVEQVNPPRAAAVQPSVPPPPEVERDPKRIWGQVLLASAGAASVGALVTVGIFMPAKQHYNHSAQCKPLRSVQCADDAQRVTAGTSAAIILGATAGALAIVGTALLWTSRRRAASDSKETSFSCTVGLGVLCAGRF